ncbi:glycosyl transferase family 1 [Neisseria meningitidis]|nr:glycosyl transferase family 1 [Neisseria meningitidis]AVI44698.1 glycosyl transferase family 1 [Neisseria meningitidis]AVI44809.1 glycosyl transferase family 1 [Neisseria meningitidis]MBG8578532.1 glycosyl transferase family 1 [Neisseria meningitidis]MBG8580040.1 glycosyl transferase family 1 [Neisseria meningitidis]
MYSPFHPPFKNSDCTPSKTYSGLTKIRTRRRSRRQYK